MGRLLLLILLVVLAVWLVKRALRPPPKSMPVENHGELVACARCGVHLPRSEARPGGDAFYYCSEEHARLGKR